MSLNSSARLVRAALNLAAIRFIMNIQDVLCAGMIANAAGEDKVAQIDDKKACEYPHRSEIKNHAQKGVQRVTEQHVAWIYHQCFGKGGNWKHCIGCEERHSCLAISGGK